MSCEPVIQIARQTSETASGIQMNSILHYAPASNCQVRTRTLDVWLDTEERRCPRGVSCQSSHQSQKSRMCSPLPYDFHIYDPDP